MSLGAKLTLWLLIPLLGMLMLLATVSLRREREIHHRQAAAEVERTANTLAIAVADALQRQSQPDLSEIVRRSTLDAARFGLAVYDRAGNPFFTWGLFAGNRSLRRENLTPVLGLPRGVGRVEEIGDMPVRSHLIALATGGTPLGGLKVTMSLQEIQAILTRERNTFLGTLAAVALLLVVLISALIHRTVSRPLGQLTERISALASGKPAEEVATSGRDEVAQLSQAFNALGRSLEETRRRLLEEAQHAGNIIQSIADGIVGMDAAGRIRTWNRAMADRYGIAQSEVLGRNLFDAFPALESEGLREEVDGLLSGAKATVVLRYFEHETRHRGRVVLNVRGSSLRDASGNIAGAVLALEDVTDRVALTQEVQQAEKLAVVGQLAAGIAHQIGTPLNVISGSAEYLMMEWSDDKARPQELEIIIAQTDRITKLIRQLLNFARPARMELHSLDLNDLLHTVLALTEHQIANEGINVTTDFEADLPPILGDANQLEQAFLNIVINAWHAMPDGGSLALSARAVPVSDRHRRVGRTTQPGVEVVIADTGTGIAPENMSKIFDPFFSTKGVGKGTGLGLAICRRIIEDHHGSIEVESVVGRGTTFTIWLPAGRATA
jgi:PAS domain S-box-containing protein